MDIGLIDLIGHVGYACLCGGTWALARGHRVGWIARLAGEVIWMLLGIALGMSSVILWGMVGTGVDGYGLIRNWKRQAKLDEPGQK